VAAAIPRKPRAARGKPSRANPNNGAVTLILASGLGRGDGMVRDIPDATNRPK